MKTATKKYFSYGLAAVGTAGTAIAGLLFRRKKLAAGEGLQTVPHVNIKRYMGKWYEIARYPSTFENDCYGVTVDYALRPDGSIMVLNTCRQGSPDGPIRASEGTAKIVDTKTGAKLSFVFLWMFSGDYWIVDLGKHYEYSVGATPDKSNVWILSRTPAMDEKTYRHVLDRLEAKGFDTSKLIKTPQPRETREFAEVR